MKLIKSLLIVSAVVGTAWAQAPVEKNTKAPVAAKAPAKTATSAPKAKSAVSVAKPTPKTTRPATPVSAVGKSVANKPVPKVKAAPKVSAVATKPAPAQVEKPAAVKEDTPTVSVNRGRDPFVSPVVRSSGNIGSGCDTGKKCLVVDQIVLKGIVKSPSGFIAVVENSARRAYFMRENDPVFNGKVIRITGDTVVFQEQVMDKLGKQSMREVVKKVNAPAV
jgi:Tfp pilus assembly protein PilP